MKLVVLKDAEISQRQVAGKVTAEECCQDKTAVFFKVVTEENCLSECPCGTLCH